MMGISPHETFASFVKYHPALSRRLSFQNIRSINSLHFMVNARLTLRTWVLYSKQMFRNFVRTKSSQRIRRVEQE